MKYRTVSTIAVLLFYVPFLSAEPLGFSYSGSGGSVNVLVESAPVHVAQWFIALAAYCLPFFLRDPSSWSASPAGLVRRCCGFVIDFHICFSLTVVPFTLLAVGVEYLSTGDFVWSFERSESIEADAFLMPLGAATLVALLALLSFPLARQQRSVGATVLGYGLRADKPVSLWASCCRTLYGFWTLAAGILSVPSAARRDDRRLWHDLAYDVYPLKVDVR
ncbi:MAG: RDD family protein [Pseudomonadota bacterium]